ncbi:hypothetical protein PRZ48_014769 [Zasmidium cellare]|uniref:Tautomerase cis-CaaD-like domain-containing protein n=1 Tax=Zasmidium cellare TaxID=395010 RepID=A0ABR0DZV0_ZASCE|nr:hypothetical protein PRZ48_014769 [Zasmidium cellare]
MDELADAITTIHSTKFSTPRLFVNVRFSDATTHNSYIAGKKRPANHIVANVRVGPSRTQADWNSLCADIVSAWNRIVPMPKVRRSDPDVDHELRSCILLGGMIGGYEAGFMIPKAGDDGQWLRDHWEEFEMKAQGGDGEFREMIDEVKERGLLGGADGKSSKQKLEEMLGWGDSA